MPQPLGNRDALYPRRRRLFRRSAGERVFVGLLLILAFGTTTWQSATGSQCQRRLADAALQMDGVATPALDAAHGHAPAADTGTPAPGVTCPVLAHVVREAGVAPHDAGASTPQAMLARLVTSTDPPALFRPPRLT